MNALLQYATEQMTTTVNHPKFKAGDTVSVWSKILDEKGIATSQVAGSGPGGRITKEDAANAQASAPAKAESKPAAASAPVAAAVVM